MHAKLVNNITCYGKVNDNTFKNVVWSLEKCSEG